MWDRAELKADAKNVLRKGYWIPFFASLIAGFLSADNFGGGGVTGVNISFSGSPVSMMNSSQSMSWNEFFIFMSIFSLLFGFIMLIAIAFTAFLSNPIIVGKRRFFMENSENKSPLDRLFFSFGKNYLKIVKVMFMQNLFIFLWTLLLIIPGIIKSYEYRMVPFILSENPDITWQRALELSREMTRGEKFNIFVLDLSFLGWIFLGILACFIGVLFVQPYIDATNAELYRKMREKAFSSNLSTGEELPGFATA